MSEASPSNDPLNVFSVETLLKYMGNDDKALAVVVKIVRDACIPGMQPIILAQTALAEQRLTDAGKIFHSLRGSVGSLGAKGLVASSMALELAIAEQRIEDIPALLATLESEYRLVLRHADAWLALHAPADGPAA